MLIKDAAKLSGLSQDTIRFYHKSGMLPPLARDTRGWRVFRQSDIDWLQTLERLRTTGMPLSDVKRFSSSAHAPDCDCAAQRELRLSILQNHRTVLAKKRSELDTCDAFLNHKIKIYTDLQE